MIDQAVKDAVLHARVAFSEWHEEGDRILVTVTSAKPIDERVTRYLDRSNVRPGMAVRGGLLVRAFAAVGWRWGGRWTGAPDYQHFSATGG